MSQARSVTEINQTKTIAEEFQYFSQRKEDFEKLVRDQLKIQQELLDTIRKYSQPQNVIGKLEAANIELNDIETKWNVKKDVIAKYFNAEKKLLIIVDFMKFAAKNKPEFTKPENNALYIKAIEEMKLLNAETAKLFETQNKIAETLTYGKSMLTKFGKVESIANTHATLFPQKGNTGEVTQYKTPQFGASN